MKARLRAVGRAPIVAAVAVAVLAVLAAIWMHPNHRARTGNAPAAQDVRLGSVLCPPSSGASDLGTASGSGGSDVGAGLLPSAPPTDAADLADTGDVPVDGLGEASTEQGFAPTEISGDC